MNSGGAQRQLIGLARCLENLSEYKVRLLFYKKGANFYISQLDAYKIDYCYDCSSNFKWNGFFALRKQIKGFQPDLIISFLGETNLFACLNKVFCNIPLIVSERNTTIVPTKLDRLRFFLYRWADRIVPNSFSQEKYLIQEQHQIAHKIVPIINFVDTQIYKPAKKEKANEIRKIIVVARVVPQKNVINFIHAVKFVVDCGCVNFHIDWIGNLGMIEYVERCVKLIDDLHLTDFISFVGECKGMVDVYQKADIFCLPSFYEGTPNVVCEAMSCGLPILCSDVCDNARYVEREINGGLFDPYNIHSIADTIISFVNYTNDTIINMGKNSRDKALNSFSVEKFNVQWHEQIKQLIG